MFKVTYVYGEFVMCICRYCQISKKNKLSVRNFYPVSDSYFQCQDEIQTVVILIIAVTLLIYLRFHFHLIPFIRALLMALLPYKACFSGSEVAFSRQQCLQSPVNNCWNHFAPVAKPIYNCYDHFATVVRLCQQFLNLLHREYWEYSRNCVSHYFYYFSQVLIYSKRILFGTVYTLYR